MRPFDLHGLRTYDLQSRPSKVFATDLGRPVDPSTPVGDWLDLPQPVELCIRQHPETGERLIFLLNYSDQPQTITLHKTVTDVLGGKQMEGLIELAPFDVCVLSENDATGEAVR